MVSAGGNNPIQCVCGVVAPDWLVTSWWPVAVLVALFVLAFSLAVYRGQARSQEIAVEESDER